MIGAWLRKFASSVPPLAVRVVDHYAGPGPRNTIEYWQRYIFYVISLSGCAAGTLCLIPSLTVILLKGQWLGAAVLAAVYLVNVYVVVVTRLAVRHKTLVIAFNFYLFGVMSLILAGPEGESGIWFSVSVLLCSLFAGFRASLGFAILNLATGMVFGVLHSRGLIGWEALGTFRFTSWLLQSGNIFLMDMVFVTANTLLIRGVDRTFRSLNAAEGQVRASLAEKETLIRELYHRSKNNMQVVSSLLTLHSSQLREDHSKAVFRDVVSKISSMSLVHQRLYESHDLSNVNMATYTRDLVALLLHSYGVAQDQVEVNLDLEDISMLIDTAIPCGLVITEVVANALKYAFPDGRRGRVEVSLRKGEADCVELRISDNGVGLPEGFDPASNGKLGMKTVFTMVKHQMQGDIRLESRGGVTFLIRFRRKLYEERVRSDAQPQENPHR